MIYFLFYTLLARMIFALFVGLSAITNVTTSWETSLTPNGLLMIGVQVLVGGALALLLYMLALVSLPLLLDREVDFVSAMLLRVNVVSRNPAVLGSWTTVVAGATLVAMVPWFLGRSAVLPIPGHATQHLHRRALA